jgi:hypothetical protein
VFVVWLQIRNMDKSGRIHANLCVATRHANGPI